MADAVRVDGRRCANVPADDRGLAYGDGVFRTLRVAAGTPLAWEDHLERLAHDCRRLAIAAPAPDALAADARALFADRRDGVLKIVITRGSGGRGYAPAVGAHSRRIVSAHALPAHADDRAALALDRCTVTLAEQPGLAGIKHLNRLEQVLARAECERRGAEDALMCDARGRVVCTTMRNVFLYTQDRRWITPALTRAGVAGATRQRLWRALAEHGHRVTAVDVPIETVADARAVVVCNSVGGARAVASVQGRALPDSAAAAARCRTMLAG